MLSKSIIMKLSLSRDGRYVVFKDAIKGTIVWKSSSSCYRREFLANLPNYYNCVTGDKGYLSEIRL